MNPADLHTLQQALLALGPLSPAAWQALADQLTVSHCHRGWILPVYRGDVFFVLRGLVKAEVSDGREMSIQRFIREGDFALATGQRHTQQYVALEDTSVARVDALGLRQLSREHPALSVLYEQVVAVIHEQLIIRISLLLKHKSVRYAAFKHQYPGLASRLMDKDIANYLNISSSYFSRNKV